MKFFSKIENKVKRKPKPEAPPPITLPVEPVGPGIPWYDPVEPTPLIGPTELEAPPSTRVQERVIDASEFAPSRAQNGSPIRPQHASGPTYAERERQARFDAEQRREAEERRTERIIAERKDNASTRNVRRLRRLIREKYQLDVYIWNKRYVQRALRPHILQQATKSDAILQEIIFIVNEWTRDAFEDPEEWRLAKKIQEELERGGSQTMLWADLPPWDERRENGEYVAAGVADSPHSQTGRNEVVAWA